MPHIETFPNLTESEADELVALYKIKGITAEKKKEPNGSWTVTATIPD
ncbi:MAG: hypothetical protein HGB26_08125 [Desulfobulbaceae bacterium]|nr:hypothetical protein [Desulfobulbaceae bacterium]